MPLNDKKEHNAQHRGRTKPFNNLSSLSNSIAPAVSGLFGKHKTVFTLSHHPNFLSQPSRRKNIQTPHCCHHGCASDSPVRKDITLPCLLSRLPSLRAEAAEAPLCGLCQLWEGHVKLAQLFPSGLIQSEHQLFSF